MVSVTQLAQFLLKQNPQAHVARLSFYHWVKNFLDLNAELQADMVEKFYDHALLIPYWQAHQQILGEMIEKDLALFAESHALNFDLQKIRHCHQRQLVELQYAEDIRSIVSTKIKQSDSSAKFKFLPFESNQLLVIQTTSSQGFCIQTFSPFMKIKGPNLQPLCSPTLLRYNSNLELVPGVVQLVQLGQTDWATFQMEDGNCHGVLIKGYTFQKTEVFTGKSINQYPELFYGLKQIERFYIDLRSDPLYQEVISLLERALNSVGNPHPECYQFAQTALQKGRLALKNVFPHDKLLHLLITNLEYRITEESIKSNSLSSSFVIRN